MGSLLPIAQTQIFVLAFRGLTHSPPSPPGSGEPEFFLPKVGGLGGKTTVFA